jgi:hypothetical protein
MVIRVVFFFPDYLPDNRSLLVIFGCLSSDSTLRPSIKSLLFEILTYFPQNSSVVILLNLPGPISEMLPVCYVRGFFARGKGERKGFGPVRALVQDVGGFGSFAWRFWVWPRSAP